MKGTIVIAGGGTGGHIAPGIAVYEALREKEVRVFYIAAFRDRRFPLLSEIERDDLYFYRGPALKKNPLLLAGFIFGFATSLVRSLFFFKRRNTRAVIGMGGYVSVPALLAARMMKIPVYLCEQNTVPGRVTRLFEKSARRIYATFEESREYLKTEERDIIIAGNPLRRRIRKEVNRRAARQHFNMSHVKTVVLVIGGSQGAVGVNELVVELKRNYPGRFREVGFIWITGTFSYERFREEAQKDMRAGSIYLAPFVEEMAAAYSAADLAISRSGAGVMAELAAAGLPSILVPLPGSAGNHQELNAQSFERKGAAVMVRQDQAVAGNVAQALFSLIGNERRRKEMAGRIRECARPDAGQAIAMDLLATLEEDTGENKG